MKPLITHQVWALVAGAAFTLVPLGSPAAAADDRCDRACMRGVMDQYFAAVFRHDPQAAPLAASTRATVNAAELEQGAGVWNSVTGYGAADLEAIGANIAQAAHRRFPVVDEEAGVVMGTTIFHRPPGATMKRNLLTELFVGKNEKIEAIYAAMFYLDPSAPDNPGWAVR